MTRLLGLYTVMAAETLHCLCFVCTTLHCIHNLVRQVYCVLHLASIGAGDYYNASMRSDEVSSQGLPHAFMLRHMQDQPLGELSSWHSVCGYLEKCPWTALTSLRLS